MYSNVILPRYWARLTCLCRYYSASIEGQKLPEIGKCIDGISPPVRIPRSPTDILQALAATVGNDPTAAHYKYHDDPYLTPLSNYRKRSYALSAEAGRKAAAWIKDQHSEWFTTREWDPPMKMKTPHFSADPQIPAFAPKPIYNEESKVTEEDLKYTINNGLVDDSIKVYELLGGAQNISDEMKLSLLQLLCFYNEKEPESLEWLEERWFSALTRERSSTSWKLGGLADKIFNSMDPKTPEAYCSIIQGKAKYFQAERAHQLSQEAIENGIQLSTPVYNNLIICIGFLFEGAVLRVEKLDALLNEMVERGVTPNSGTLSACLKSLSAWGGGRLTQDKALQLLADFRTIDIHPALTAYYNLLHLFCKERGPRIDILSSILDDLENRDELVATEVTDTKFFITAMAVCNEHLEDIALAERVHNLLMKGDNYKLLGDAYRESIYYRHHISIYCKRSPLDKTLQLLDELVPNVYVPEPSIMEKIIDALEAGGLGDRLAQTWSQLIVFGLANRTNLVERLLGAMCSCYQFQDAEVKTKLRAVAADIVKFGQETEEDVARKDVRTPQNALSATALCSILELCSTDADKSDDCWTWMPDVLQRLTSGEASGALPKCNVIVTLANKAASLGHTNVSLAAVLFLAEYGFEETSTACVDTLATILNRPQQEVLQVLRESRDSLQKNLDTNALAIVDTYLMNEGSMKYNKSNDTTSSSSSDSDSDSDDEHRK